MMLLEESRRWKAASSSGMSVVALSRRSDVGKKSLDSSQDRSSYLLDIHNKSETIRNTCLIYNQGNMCSGSTKSLQVVNLTSNEKRLCSRTYMVRSHEGVEGKVAGEDPRVTTIG